MFVVSWPDLVKPWYKSVDNIHLRYNYENSLKAFYVKKSRKKWIGRKLSTILEPGTFEKMCCNKISGQDLIIVRYQILVKQSIIRCKNTVNFGPPINLFWWYLRTLQNHDTEEQAILKPLNWLYLYLEPWQFEMFCFDWSFAKSLYLDAFWTMTSCIFQVHGRLLLFVLLSSPYSSSLAPHCSVAKSSKSPPWRVFLENEWRAKTSWVRLLREDTTISNLKKNWRFCQKLEILKTEDFEAKLKTYWSH